MTTDYRCPGCGEPIGIKRHRDPDTPYCQRCNALRPSARANAVVYETVALLAGSVVLQAVIGLVVVLLG